MFWENRTGLPTSPVDKSVAVVAINTPEGEPIATLINLAIHPVVLGPENLEYSSVFAGSIMDTGGTVMEALGLETHTEWQSQPIKEIFVATPERKTTDNETWLRQ